MANITNCYQFVLPLFLSFSGMRLASGMGKQPQDVWPDLPSTHLFLSCGLLPDTCSLLLLLWSNLDPLCPDKSCRGLSQNRSLFPQHWKEALGKWEPKLQSARVLRRLHQTLDRRGYVCTRETEGETHSKTGWQVYHQNGVLTWQENCSLLL